MTDNNSAVNVANYMLESILRDLNFLKDNNFLSNQVYTDVTNILPSRITTSHTTTTTITTTAITPPSLPTRKSTHSINNNAPILTQPREMPSFPKLPTRKTTTTEWQPPQQQQQQQQQQPPVMVMPKVENEKSSPPPAYSQNPNHQQQDNSLATAEAIYDYDGEDPNTDLSFQQGEIIQVTEYVNDDWWKGTVNGKTGIFPQNHVKKISPPVKAKRPWAPPKPSSFHQNSSSSPQLTNNTMPYSAPPPSASLYTPPPAQPPIQNYAQPPYAQQPYAQPQPVVVANNEEQQQQDGKVQNMAKKFGGHVATAATWGFGATLGSQAANAIF